MPDFSHFLHYASLITWLLEWWIDHFEAHHSFAQNLRNTWVIKEVPTTTSFCEEMASPVMFTQCDLLMSMVCSKDWLMISLCVYCGLGVSFDTPCHRHRAFSLAQKMNWHFFFFFLGNPVSGTKWWMLFSSNQFVLQRLHATAAALPVLP